MFRQLTPILALSLAAGIVGLYDHLNHTANFVMGDDSASSRSRHDLLGMSRQQRQRWHGYALD